MNRLTEGRGGLQGSRVLTRLVCALLCAAVLGACGPDISEDQLPPLVDVDASGYLPAIAEQVAQAQQAVADKPLDAERNGHLGVLYRVYRDYEAAEAALHRARLLAPRRTKWLYYHAEVLEQLGRNAQSLAASREFLAAQPDYAAAKERVARLLVASGELDEARPLVTELLAETPEACGVLLVHATLLERDGDYAGAAESLRQALAAGGSFGQAHYALALNLRRLGQTDEADEQMTLFESTTDVPYPRIDPLMADIFRFNMSDKPLVRAAQAAKARGDSQGALALLEQAIERNPGSMETRAGLIAGYAARNDFDAARRHVDEGSTFDASHVEYLYSVARLRLAEGKLTDAIALLRQVTDSVPQHAVARSWLGHALQLRGDNQGAGIQLARAIEDDPRNATARRFYRRWLVANAPVDEQIKELRAMSQLGEADTPALLGALARALATAGDNAAALQALDEGIALAEKRTDRRAANALRNYRNQLAQTATPGGAGP